MGWKGWSISTGQLGSAYSSIWKPEEPFKATCGNGRCKQSPAVNCTCGIYAADKKEIAHNGKETVLGQIYGWGRYIRADSGWRTEFAYPKCFFLKDDQMNLLEMLKQYRVPIYVTQPFKVYAPEDDGYEGEDDGNWEDAQNRSVGTGEDADAEED